MSMSSQRAATAFLLGMLAVQPIAAGQAVTVSSCALRTGRNDAQGIVTLMNAGGADIQSTVTVEIIDPADEAITGASIETVLSPGTTEVVVPWAELMELNDDQRQYLPWYRLRCQSNGSAGARADQIVGVAQACDEAHIVEVLLPYGGDRGGQLPVSVRTVHPISRSPQGDRQVDLRVSDDEGNVLWSQSITTSPDGSARTRMPIPADAFEELEIDIRSEWGPFLDAQREEIFARPNRSVSLATDRTMYRPGQTVRFRAIALSSFREACSGLPVAFTVLDPDYNPVMKTQLETTEFGIAHGSWSIPEDAAHGDYTIEIASSDDDQDMMYVPFQVAEYELPTFSVKASSDREFYLAGQPAALDTEVSTLAGDPMPNAVVEVLEVPDRSWWWRTQPPADEEILGSCTTETEGSCRVELGLEDAHADLWTWRRFDDYQVVVRVTEPATGRVAYRTVSLRASREPIHVYLRNTYDNSPGVSLVFMVSTFTAGGRPEPCVVDIHRMVDDEPGELLATVETNQYGLAEVSLTYDEFEADGYLDDVYLIATASGGESGRTDGWLWDTNQPVLRVVPNRVYHREGEPIQVLFQSNIEESRLFCEVWIGDEYLFERPVSLEDHHAELRIAYDDRFRGEVRLEAYLEPQGADTTEANGGTATVIYPGDATLKLTLEVDPEATEPGKPVTARLRVADSTGADRAASVGVAVIDEAVEALLEDLGDPMAVAAFTRQSEATLYRWEASFAGIRRRDLSGFDPRDLPAGLETVARYLLEWEDTWRMVLTTDGMDRVSSLYLPRMRHELAGLVNKCDREIGAPCPVTVDDLEDLVATRLGAEGLDPWGSRFRAELKTVGKTQRAIVTSNGPDHTPKTADDLVVHLREWRWFAPHGQRLTKALKDVYPNTGTWPTTPDDVLRTAEESGIDWSDLRDPWNHPLEVKTSTAGHRISISVMSPGPDGVWATGPRENSDDIYAWSVVLDTFEPTSRWIEDALAITDAAGRATPDTPQRLREILANSDLPEVALVDLHGNPYKLEVGIVPVYTDRYRHSENTFEVDPIIEGQLTVSVTSKGPDGQSGTQDDVSVALLKGAPLSAQEPETKLAAPENYPLNALLGAISGVVLADGLPLPGVTVGAETTAGEDFAIAIADASGRFTLVVPPGVYKVTFSLLGFAPFVKDAVTVEGWKITVIDAELTPESFGGEILVSASIPEVETTAVVSASTVDEDSSTQQSKTSPTETRPFSTPRVRRDFPETLFWEPDLLVDGSTSVEFDLADAVTTWRVQAVASTVDGRLAVADTEVIASLPFFVQLERPQTLTVGDRIDLPALVRNFTDDFHKVNLRLKAGPGIDVNRDKKSLKVGARQSSRIEFRVHAKTATDSAVVQLEAVGDGTGDAVEHAITVRPLAEERSEIVTALVRDQARLEIEIPDTALPGTVESKLRVLPSLASQVAESIEGLLTRPGGCGEQITSTAFVHLMHLRLTSAEQPSSDSTADSLRAVEEGKARLKDLITAEGGVPFWSGGTPRVALTAYALRFLVTLDEPETSKLAQRLVAWLLEQQREDGGWSTHSGDNTEVDVQLTAFVIRALAEASGAVAFPDGGATGLGLALDLLERRVGRFAEPHALSSYVLACVEVGRPAAARKAAERLAADLRTEATSCYWHIGANTPLDGWGLPGRIESTALAVQAFASVDSEKYADQIECGTRFLMTHKDPFSSWYSTQTTVATLEALTAAGLGSGEPAGTLVVRHDGREVKTLDIPTDEQALISITVDLDSASVSGSISVDLDREGGDALIGAELVTTYFVPWGDPDSGDPNLAFDVVFDDTDLTVGEKTSCRVHAARVAHRGYGMLLAEVGLPPGAVVDRPALQQQLGRQFEIWPDRVVLYLMARPGGTDIEIPFTPRFSGKVVSTASLLYDYYNPLARVVREPVQFTIAPDRKR